MEYVTVRLHNGAALSGGAARLLVDYALRRRGRDCWSAVSAELFRGRRETLLIARPFAGVEVRLADYTLPFLRSYYAE